MQYLESNCSTALHPPCSHVNLRSRDMECGAEQGCAGLRDLELAFLQRIKTTSVLPGEFYSSVSQVT